MTKYIKEQHGPRGRTHVRIYETEVPNYEGRLALDFIMALIAAQPDGRKAVQRGCELAVETLKEFRARGWMVALPDIEPAELDPTP